MVFASLFDFNNYKVCFLQIFKDRGNIKQLNRILLS